MMNRRGKFSLFYKGSDNFSYPGTLCHFFCRDYSHGSLKEPHFKTPPNFTPAYFSIKIFFVNLWVNSHKNRLNRQKN